MSAHVVILGCGRSGTSIFGELFEHLTPYRYHFELPFEALESVDFSAGPVAIKVPKRAPGQPMTAGLPFLLGDLLAVVPQPRVLFWQIRHPLDAICSLRPGIAAVWSHNPRPPDWQEWMQQPLVMQCARHWQYINETGYLAVQSIVTVTRYERLVEAPFDFAADVARGIGLDPVACAPQLDAWAASVGNRKSPDSYEAKHQVHWSRQDHTTRIDRWRENLSDAEIEAVLPLIVNAARLHGYELPASMPRG
jgi:hypothetical protein